MPEDEPYFHPYAPGWEGVTPGGLAAEISYSLAGEPACVRVPAETTPAVVPPLSLRAEPAVLLINLERPVATAFEVEWRSFCEAPLEGVPELGLPEGWRHDAVEPVALRGVGESATSRVVTPFLRSVWVISDTGCCA